MPVLHSRLPPSLSEKEEDHTLSSAVAALMLLKPLMALNGRARGGEAFRPSPTEVAEAAETAKAARAAGAAEAAGAKGVNPMEPPHASIHHQHNHCLRLRPIHFYPHG